MLGKRKISARIRSEPSRKRRSSSLEDESVPRSPHERVLPTKLEAGRPLPTVDKPMLDISAEAYKSFSESGVIAASLQTSKNRWLSEGIFERYWVKPKTSKKKLLEDTHKTLKKRPHDEMLNPSKDTMVKVGLCTLTVEPHVFETTVFAVRDPAVADARSYAPPSGQRPIIQFGPAASNGSHSVAVREMESSEKQQNGTGNGHYRPIEIKTEPVANGDGHSHDSPVLVNSQESTNVAERPRRESIREESNGTSKSKTDPVIQMLATRAATDSNLKALMKVVASGVASQAELQVFQSHIDELTLILKNNKGSARSETRNGEATRTTTSPTSNRSTRRTSGHHSRNGSHSFLGQLSPTRPDHHQPKPDLQQRPHSTKDPVRLKSKSSTTTNTTTDLTHVALEFSAGSGDRFLFPKYSILDYQPGGTEVVVSFLVVRKGSFSDSDSYDPQSDYYQPITMRLSAHHPRTLAPLAEVVAPPDAVRAYMNRIMENTTRAEYVYLAMQLPKDLEPRAEAGAGAGTPRSGAQENGHEENAVVLSKKEARPSQLRKEISSNRDPPPDSARVSNGDGRVNGKSGSNGVPTAEATAAAETPPTKRKYTKRTTA